MAAGGVFDPVRAFLTDPAPAASDNPTGFPGAWLRGDALAAVAGDAALANVSALWDTHWEHRDGRLVALPPYAYFRVDGGPSGTLTARLAHDDARWQSIGYVGPGGGPRDLVLLHQWLPARGETADVVVHAPPSLEPGGQFFLSAGTQVHALRFVPA